MLQKIKLTFGKTDGAVREYPMMLLMALLAAVSLICYADGNYNSNPNYFVFIKFALVCCLGISLMFAVKMLAQRIGKGILLEIAAVLFLIFFYFLLPEKERDFTEKYAFLIIPTFILSHLLVSFVAFTGKNKEIRFWQYNKNLFINIFLTAVFTGVLTGGAELAVLAIDKLFDFNFSDRLYVQLFYFLAIFGSCFIFLLFSEEELKNLEKYGNYPIILKFFTQYILIPLLIIYAFILYFYAAKILINWELPRGWVSYLILAYSLVGILALLLVHPLKQDSTKSWVKLFSRIFYFSLSPLLILLFTAIFTRILEYGYTEPRYFVLLLSLWLSTVVLYFIFAPKTTIKFIPMSLFTFGLFALTVPYLNTFSVAKRGQKTELQKVLQENNLLRDNQIDFTKKVSDTVADEVAGKFAFLMQRGESVFLMNYLNKTDKIALAKQLTQRNAFGLQNNVRFRFSNVVNTRRMPEYNRLEIVAESKVQKITGFDYMIGFEDFYNDTNFKIGDDVFSISSRTGMPDMWLKIKLNNSETWDVTPFIRQTVSTNAQRKGRQEVPELMTERVLGKYHIKVFFNMISRENTNREQINFNGGYILIKEK